MDGIDRRFAEVLTNGWKVLLMRGLAAIAFGIFTWARPAISLAALVLVFGAYALFDGVLAAWTTLTGPKDQQYWWVPLLGGLLGIVIGVLTLARPGVTAVVLLVYIAVWAIMKGVVEIAVAIRVRRVIEGEWRLTVAGAASILFGIFLLARPNAGALTVVWLIATYAVAFGILLVMLAFEARNFTKQVARV